MTPAAARVEMAIALRLVRDGRSWEAAAKTTGLSADVLMTLEGVWESRRRVMIPELVRAARGYGVPLEDLLPGSALRCGPRRLYRWSAALHTSELVSSLQKTLQSSGVDLHALFKAENHTIRRRFNRLVVEKPDVFWMALAADRCGTTLAEWLPREWRPAPLQP